MFISGKYVKPEFEEKAKKLLENMQVIHIDDYGNVYSDNEICNSIYICGAMMEKPYGEMGIKSQIYGVRCSNGKIRKIND